MSYKQLVERTNKMNLSWISLCYGRGIVERKQGDNKGGEKCNDCLFIAKTCDIRDITKWIYHFRILTVT